MPRSCTSTLVLAALAVLCLTVPSGHAAAQETNMKRAYAASQSAKAYKQKGDLGNAESMFRIVLENAPESSSIHREAEDELAYFLPLMRVQRLLWEGDTEAAEEELLRLQLQVDNQPLRRQEINRIKGT